MLTKSQSESVFYRMLSELLTGKGSGNVSFVRYFSPTHLELLRFGTIDIFGLGSAAMITGNRA